MVLFSIRDNKSERGNRPFASETRGTAMREISLGLKDDNPMVSFAADFALYEIATFDQDLMKIVPTDPAHHICEISELLPPILEAPDAK